MILPCYQREQSTLALPINPQCSSITHKLSPEASSVCGSRKVGVPLEATGVPTPCRGVGGGVLGPRGHVRATKKIYGTSESLFDIGQLEILPCVAMRLSKKTDQKNLRECAKAHNKAAA